MISSKPKFVLGVGAQKAGTTFLYELLRKSQLTRMSELKEMHVFDRAFLAPSEVLEWTAPSRLAMAMGAVRQKLSTWRHGYPNPASLAADFGKYVDYFRRLVEGAEATGEITPSYALLHAEHFRQIRALLTPHFELRVIFFLRDPVERVFSQMKMHQTLGKIDSAQSTFRSDFTQPFVVGRTRYENTIRALEGAFLKEEVFYSLYESFFGERDTGPLQEFLGMPLPDVEFGVKVNHSFDGGIAEADRIAAVRSHFSATYEFCAQRFGHDFLKRYWKHY